MSDIPKPALSASEHEILRYLLSWLPDPLPLDLANRARAIYQMAKSA